MQNSMGQQEQLGCQQALQQQMVLCPVRFVYETQILVPPGDQIQPNQTFLINPQNPPPWAQNRQVQNQVVYLQQLTSNMLPSPQQHMEQNQMYLQHNIGNYQIQQPMLAQNNMTNMMPNMIHNIQQNERNVNLNTNQIQMNTQIHPLIRQMQNQATQNMELQRQCVRPQMPQQTGTRPMMAVTHLQSMPIQQTLTQMPNMMQTVNFGQTYMSNVGQARPITQNINPPRNVQPVNVPISVNMTNVQPTTKVRDTTTIEPNKTVNSNVGSPVPIPNISNRNFLPNYTYRPIHPRPQIRHSSTQVQTKQLIQTPIYVSKSSPQTAMNVPTNTFISNIENRKRKSESPDEIQKKMAVTKTIYNSVPQSITVTKISNEVGVNTSPVHRIDNRNILSNNTMLQINSNSAQIVKIVDNTQKSNENVLNSLADDQNITEKDKLVRNTVFTQARGGFRHETASTNDVKQTNVEEDVKLPENQVQVNKQAENKAIAIETHEIKAEIKETIEADVTDDGTSIPKDELTENTCTDEVKDEEVEIERRIMWKQDRDSILTHVVDGYVIQESSIAFPIRKPLKEKTLLTNALREGDASKDRDGNKMTPIDLPLLPFHYLHLNNEITQDTAKESDADENGSPFSNVQHVTVKSWTVDDLAKHLLKYDWKDTVSVLQDHEIDGESLFLVSKSQLQTIGVNEDHADIICEFVKS